MKAIARLIATLLIAAGVVQPAAGQERAPDGRVFGELLPFVELKSVSVEVNGITNVIHNVPGDHRDPAKAATGLSGVELEQLEKSIHEDIAAAFRRRAVPLIGPNRESGDLRPRLVVDIRWNQITKGTFVVNVGTTFLEAGQLLKDPSRTVWVPSWSTGFQAPTPSRTLARTLRSAALGGVNNFVDLYARAHAK